MKEQRKGGSRSLPTDLPATDNQLLDLIESKGTTTASSLAADLGLTRMGAHKRLTQLEDRGFAERERGAGRRPDVWTTTGVRPDGITLDDLRRAQKILDDEGRSLSLDDFR